MDLKHCPSSATLADFSFGNGFSTSEIVLRAHISACRHCRTKIREIEAIGSDLLMNDFHNQLGTFSEDIDSKVDEIVEGYDSSCDRNSAKSLNLSNPKRMTLNWTIALIVCSRATLTVVSTLYRGSRREKIYNFASSEKTVTHDFG